MRRVIVPLDGVTPITHVYPTGDYRAHWTSGRECWCKPIVEEGFVVVHNSMDGREAFESGDRRKS